MAKSSTLLRSGCDADTSSPIGNCKSLVRLHAGTPLFSIKPLSSVSICKRPRLPGLARRNGLWSAWIPLKCATASKVEVRGLRHRIPMASSIDKTQTIAQPTSGSGNETARGRSIATRLTEAEFGEVEAAAAIAGKKVGEWLREAALAQARGTHHNEQTDQILLAEMMGMRSLMLNLFARASEGPLTAEDLRKMSAYSDSIKDQRAQDYMAERRRRNSPKPTDKP
jgi:hypothetical protein